MTEEYTNIDEPPPSPASQPDSQGRIDQLEQAVSRLTAQVEELKKQFSRQRRTKYRGQPTNP